MIVQGAEERTRVNISDSPGAEERTRVNISDSPGGRGEDKG